jgi:hypothetical protein
MHYKEIIKEFITGIIKTITKGIIKTIITRIIKIHCIHILVVHHRAVVQPLRVARDLLRRAA